MALGDYTKTTYVNGSAPALSASNLNNNENKVDEIDSWAATATPVGSMTMYAGTSIPTGWLLCNGQAVSRTTYASLFNAISTTWGVGDGSTTFNVPDMRESSPYGAGTYSVVTGTTHGAITAHDALALGASAEDRAQGHWHEIELYNNGTTPNVSSGTPPYSAPGTPVVINRVRQMVTDGTNGTPRMGATTRGKIIGLNFIIKT